MLRQWVVLAVKGVNSKHNLRLVFGDEHGRRREECYDLMGLYGCTYILFSAILLMRDEQQHWYGGCTPAIDLSCLPLSRFFNVCSH